MGLHAGLGVHLHGHRMKRHHVAKLRHGIVSAGLNLPHIHYQGKVHHNGGYSIKDGIRRIKIQGVWHWCLSPHVYKAFQAYREAHMHGKASHVVGSHNKHKDLWIWILTLSVCIVFAFIVCCQARLASA